MINPSMTDLSHLPSLDGWRAFPAGADLALFPIVQGVDAAIRVREGQPLRRAAVIARERIEEMGCERVHVAAPERLQTIEGELAALVVAAGQVGGRRFRRAIGVVFGDDACATIDGLDLDGAGDAGGAGAASVIDTVRALTRHYTLGLGLKRRRRFVFRRPDGWTGCARGLTTELYAPGFPGTRAMIVVPPARPLTPVGQGLCHHQLLSALGAEPSAAVGEPLAAASGLTGALYTSAMSLGDEIGYVDAVVLTDADYEYTIRLETLGAARAAALGALRALVDSVEPVPTPARDERAVHDALAHWLS